MGNEPISVDTLARELQGVFGHMPQQVSVMIKPDGKECIITYEGENGPGTIKGVVNQPLHAVTILDSIRRVIPQDYSQSSFTLAGDGSYTFYVIKKLK